MNKIQYSSRLHVVDALRGFAIVAILLLHNIEHFDVYFTPQNLPEWMPAVDQVIWDSLFFLFGGKAYAMFALLFGLTYHIQTDNQRKRGKSFEGRFAWRMVLLLGFGFINSAFFEGDILMIYAALGFLLIPLGRLSNKWMLVVAILLLLLPGQWPAFIKALQNPGMEISNPVSWSYFGKMGEYIYHGNLWDTFVGNLTNGKKAVILWNLENGRFFLILSYFLFGILAGRKNLFAQNETNTRFWKRTLLVAIVLFIPLFLIRKNTGAWIDSAAIKRSVDLYLSTFANTAFMVVLVSGFTLLFWNAKAHNPLNYFSAFGKMSLSNYVMQSIVGSMVYYGFGLGLYKYTGASYSLLIGLAMMVLMAWFCQWWMGKNKRGPLEGIWHKLTWI